MPADNVAFPCSRHLESSSFQKAAPVIKIMDAFFAEEVIRGGGELSNYLEVHVIFLYNVTKLSAP
jgi:hypothetical protein